MPHGIAVDQVNDIIYVGNHEGGTVSVLDGATGSLLQTFAEGGALGANGVVYDPIQKRLLVANKFTDDVVAFGLPGGGMLDRIEVGSQPDGLALDAIHHLLFVPNFSDGTFSVVDTEALVELVRAPIGLTPSHVVFDPISGHAFITQHIANSVAEVDGAGTLVRTWPTTGAGPYGIAIDVAGRRLFTANRIEDSITVLLS